MGSDYAGGDQGELGGVGELGSVRGGGHAVRVGEAGGEGADALEAYGYADVGY